MPAHRVISAVAILCTSISFTVVIAAAGKIKVIQSCMQCTVHFVALTGPVSVSVLVGENALFYCNGSGVVIQWVADGIYVTDTDPVIVARGISATTSAMSSGKIQSILTVPATSVNNGTTVHCILFPGSVTSSNATLIVLHGELYNIVSQARLFGVIPRTSGLGELWSEHLCLHAGIGQVANVRFGPSLDDVLWDPPATAGVLGGLSYIVIVMNNNTGQVIVSAITNNTNYPLSALQLCQFYTANVTAFSSEHHSDSVVTELRVPGGECNCILQV